MKNVLLFALEKQKERTDKKYCSFRQETHSWKKKKIHSNNLCSKLLNQDVYSKCQFIDITE